MTSSSSDNVFSIRKFDGHNFLVWMCQIEAYVRVKECYEAIIQDGPSLLGDEKKRAEILQEWTDRNNVASGVLLLSLCDEQAILVYHLSKDKQIWDRLIQATNSNRKGVASH